MITLHRNRRHAEHLLRVAAGLRDQDPDHLRQLGERILALSDSNPSRRGASILNNDGALLQIVLSSSPNSWKLRVIGDPAADRFDLGERYGHAVAVARDVLKTTETSPLAPVFDQACHHLLSQDSSRYRNGPLWIAAEPDNPSIAVYFDASADTPETAWDRSRSWLRDALSPADHALRTLDILTTFATPASFGFEGSHPENVRAKIYFRLKRPRPLAAFGISPFDDPSFARYLEICLEDQVMANDGFVASIGFGFARGDLVDAKIDLCGCSRCLERTPARWIATLQQLGREFGVAALPVQQALADPAIEVAFVGLGMTHDRRDRRLNLYLKSALRHPLRGANDALADGIDFLRSAQNPNGSWTDYELPVGPSDQWVTAYVACALAMAGAREPALDGARWLTQHRTYDAGWGYNGTTGPDADSTALALQLFEALGSPVREADRAFLRSLLRDGGCATYSSNDAWGCAHPDVTAMAFLALLPAERTPHLKTVKEYLAGTRLKSGLWPSYWWRQPFYATYFVLKLLRRMDLDESWLPAPTIDEQHHIDDAFNLACLIGVQALRGKDVTSLLETLLRSQRADGSFDSAANLRVTDPACFTPWVAPQGELYVDIHRTLTTATVVRVLAGLKESPGR